MAVSQRNIDRFSDTKRFPTRTVIENEQQCYVDDPVYKLIAKAKILCIELAQVFKSPVPRDIYDIVEYKRFILKWEKQTVP